MPVVFAGWIRIGRPSTVNDELLSFPLNGRLSTVPTVRTRQLADALYKLLLERKLLTISWIA